MSLRRHRSTVLVFAAFVLLGSAVVLFKFSKANAASLSAGNNEAMQGKIARAMSAGPDDIARSARIVDTDSNGTTLILREGSSGFTCMPGNPAVIGEPPMCVDAASLQWYADAKAHSPKATNTVPGITYMLAGATQTSWDVHKTIRHVGAFYGHELWLKQVGCNREGIVFSTL
jgi:hypothetical protein